MRSGSRKIALNESEDSEDSDDCNKALSEGGVLIDGKLRDALGWSAETAKAEEQTTLTTGRRIAGLAKSAGRRMHEGMGCDSARACG